MLARQDDSQGKCHLACHNQPGGSLGSRSLPWFMPPIVFSWGERVSGHQWLQWVWCWRGWGWIKLWCSRAQTWESKLAHYGDGENEGKDVSSTTTLSNQGRNCDQFGFYSEEEAIQWYKHDDGSENLYMRVPSVPLQWSTPWFSWQVF